MSDIEKGSPLFRGRVGTADWRVCLLKLLSEIFNKKGKTVRIAIGSAITPDKQAEFNLPRVIVQRASIKNSQSGENWTMILRQWYLLPDWSA